MRGPVILGLVLGCAAVFAIGAAGVWLTNDLRMMGAGVIPVGVAAAAIAAYQEVREKRRIERERHERSSEDERARTRLAA